MKHFVNSWFFKEDGVKIGAPVESAADEARVALTPDSARQLAKLGHSCIIQKGAGKAAGFSDDTYQGSAPERCRT
jgi:NAD(P) transhydrogenase subunit alpha